MREEPKPTPTVAEWGAAATAILGGATRDELQEMASVASRVRDQALVQSILMLQETSAEGDDELLTPAQVCREFGTTKHSVMEALRRKQLQVWLPHPGAIRNRKVRRAVARAWAGGASGDAGRSKR